MLASQAVGQQTPQSYDNRWAYGNAPYSNARMESQPPLIPFGPHGFQHNAQPFAPADISDYGTGPKPKLGWFFSYDRLIWTLSKPSTETIGSVAAQTTIIVNDQPVFIQNSFTTDFLKSDWANGNRFEIGYMDTDDHGWLVGVIDHVRQSQAFDLAAGQILFNDPNGVLRGFLDQNADGFDDDLNGNNVFGRDGIDLGTPNPTPPPDFVPPPDGIPDTPAPVDLGDLQTFPPLFDAVLVGSRTIVNGVEVMRTYRAPRLHNGGNFELLYGVRFLQIDDWFGITALGGIMDRTSIESRVQNNIVGPQIGGRWYLQRGRWIVSAEGRFMAGTDFENLRQKSLIATNATGGIVGDGTTPIGNVRNAPLNLTPYGAQSTQTDYEFAPAGEIRFQAAYQVTRAVALKIGYTALYVDGITRASNRINYTLPELGITTGGSNQDMFMQGLNLGVEVNR